MSVQSALLYELENNAAVGALIGTDIYDTMAPRGAGFPRIILTQVSGSSEHQLRGETRVANTRIQIASWGTTVDSAIATSDAVRLAISGKTGQWGAGANLATIESCTRQGSFQSVEDPVDGREVRPAIGVIEEYSVIYIQTPAS